MSNQPTTMAEQVRVIRDERVRARAALAVLGESARTVAHHVTLASSAVEALTGHLADGGLLGDLDHQADALEAVASLGRESRNLNRILGHAAALRGEGRVWHAPGDVPQDEPGLVIRDVTGDEARCVAPWRWHWSKIDSVVQVPEALGGPPQSVGWSEMPDVYFPVVEVLS